MFAMQLSAIKADADLRYGMLAEAAENITSCGGCGTLAELREYFIDNGEVYAGALKEVECLQKTLEVDDLNLHKFYVLAELEKPQGFDVPRNAAAYMRRLEKQGKHPAIVRFGFRCAFIAPDDVLAVLEEFYLPGECLCDTFLRVSHTETMRNVCGSADLPLEHWGALYDGLHEMMYLLGEDYVPEKDDFQVFFNCWNS